MQTFNANIELIGINPYVLPPDKVLAKLFEEAKKDKGPIPIKGSINGNPYKQNLVRFKGAWRLYINTTMLKDSPKRIGEHIEVCIAFDPEERTIAVHPEFIKALAKNKTAKNVFDSLRPSLQKEIVRYLANLKTEESVTKNIPKAIDFLLGKGRFVGRDKPDFSSK
jgi:hypothetical protein